MLLLKTDDFSREILDSLPIIVIITSGSDIVNANYSFFDFVGLDNLEEFKDNYKCISDLFINEEEYIVDQQNGLSWIEQIKANRFKKIESKVMMFNSLFNENRSYLVSYSKLGGSKDGAIISFTDITDSIKYRQMLADSTKALETLVKQRTKELVAANEKLIHKERLLIEQSKLAEMGEMIGAIAHQWKQPLNSLALYVQDVPDSVEFGEMNQEYAEELAENCMEQISYMNQTIEDFKNFFKPSKDEDFSITKSVDSAFSLIQKQFEKLKIDVVKNYQLSENEKCWGLVNEFKQVIINILNNAKEAMFEQSVENKKIEINISKSGNRAVIEIKDNGGGIPEEVLPKIFNTYFTTKGEKGTGIGLQIAKTIIEVNLHGKISAYNSAGGAVFKIELPLV